jgi:hypothetical protein
MRSSRRLPLPALGALAALAVAGCGGGSSSGGGGGAGTNKLATLRGDGFSVSMPGKPKRSEQAVPTPRGTVKAISYTSDSRDRAFSIGYTELPKGAEGDLHGAITGGAINVGGIARDEVDTTYQGFKARDARITGAADNKGTLFLRAILVKNRLYVLQFIGDGANLKKPSAAYSQIINSLKIG